MKKLTESQVKNIKEKLIKFKNELIRKNRVKKDNDIYNAWFYGGIAYRGIKDIRYLFNEDEDEDIKDVRYLLNEDNDVDEDKITYKEFPFKSIIAHIRNKLSKFGDKMIKKALYYVEEMKKLTESQVKNIKEKLIIFKDEIIIRNKLNNRIKNDLDDHNGDTKYEGIKDIRYLFKRDEDQDQYEDIRYLFNENEDVDEDKITYKESPFKSIIADIRYLSNENKGSLFKSIIADIRNKLSKSGDKMIKKALYYVEEMNELTKSKVNTIKEKLIKFKNDLIMKNKVNNRIKKDFGDY